jgi:glucose/arabinose dehydrogenase
MTRPRLWAVAGLALALAACSKPHFTPDKQYGANPPLPDPIQYLFPPMGIAKPIGWQNGATPTAPAGFTVTAFASDLKTPRRVLPLPNGDLLVAESDNPGYEPTLRPKDLVFNLVIGQAHGPTKAANDVLLLRDTNGDGKADQKTVLISGLNSPFGLAVSNGKLYVAETDAIREWDFTPGQTSVKGPGLFLTELPGGPIDHHWTKDIVVSPDGTKLYAGVGSNSNIVERGLEAEKGRARILEVELPSGASRPYATGLRNPNGLTFNPDTGQLWAVVNERDELGNNLVPDYLTSVKQGAFYGWPWSYYGAHVDVRVRPTRTDKVNAAIPPDDSLSSHVAPLGLAFAPASWPGRFANGAFIGEHGSWDREVLNGYEVSFVPFAGGRPAGAKEHFLTGFVQDGKARGRPVGVGFGPGGALYVADDVGNVVWRVAPAQSPAAPPKGG